MVDEKLSTDNVDVAMIYAAMKITTSYSHQDLTNELEDYARTYKAIRDAYEEGRELSAA